MLWGSRLKNFANVPLKHLFDINNFSDIIGQGFFLVFCQQYAWSDDYENHYKGFLFIAVFFGLARSAILFLQVFSSTRYIEQMILETIKDMLPFLLVLMLLVLWYAFLLIALTDLGEKSETGPPTDGTIKDAFDKAFKTMLVDNDYNEFKTNEGYFIYYVGNILLVVIMLNLIISVVSDSYDKVNHLMRTSNLRLKAYMI